MSPPRELTADRVVLPALGLGVAGDLLFRAPGMGVNVPIWLGGVVLAWWGLRSRHEEEPGRVERR